MQKQGEGRGPGREATRRREGRSPRLGGWAAAAVSSRSPAHSAAITVRRGRLPGRPPPPPQGHGGARSKAPPLTCSRGSLADQVGAAGPDWVRGGGLAGRGLGEPGVLQGSGLCPTHALRSALCLLHSLTRRMQWSSPGYGKRGEPRFGNREALATNCQSNSSPSTLVKEAIAVS